MIFVKDNPEELLYQSSDEKIFASWQFMDGESEISLYQMRIIELISSTKIPVWPLHASYETFIPDGTNDFIINTIVELDLQNGHKYAVDVIATNGAGFGSKHESVGVIVDTTDPVVSQVCCHLDSFIIKIR